jgi:regulator of protease activity HflC (stomatin/prohibitin superfamily)
LTRFDQASEAALLDLWPPGGHAVIRTKLQEHEMSQFIQGPNNRRRMPFSNKALTGAGAVVVILVLVWLLDPFYQVDAGYAGVLTNFGAPSQETLLPGLHWKTPIISNIYEVDITPNTATTTESAATHDQQNVSTSIAVTFQVNPADAVYIYQNYRDIASLQNTIISPIVSNDVKAIVSIYDAQDLITKREQLAGEIKDKIATDLRVYDVIVDGVNITNFDFSAAYDQAIENKQIAQQNALEEQYHLQQVQVSAQQQVVQANAQADAAVATAQGAAKATILQAQADAQAYELKQKTLTPELIELALINKWDGRMPTYASTALPSALFGAADVAKPAAPAP